MCCKKFFCICITCLGEFHQAKNPIILWNCFIDIFSWTEVIRFNLNVNYDENFQIKFSEKDFCGGMFVAGKTSSSCFDIDTNDDNNNGNLGRKLTPGKYQACVVLSAYLLMPVRYWIRITWSCLDKMIIQNFHWFLP